MMALMAQSQYNNWPLVGPNSIRLLTISANAGEGSTITCTLTSFKLDEAPPYIALSYTWGTADDRRNIILNPGNVTLSVTRNCHSALSRLRTCYLTLGNSVQHLWCDAICIDQSNIPERNGQVAMMADIYRTANRVVIDIGEIEDSEDALFALFAIQYLEETQNTDKLTVFPFEVGERVRDSVMSLYNRPWFKRVWVLQEAFMAEVADVMCGTRIEKWSHFRLKRFWLDTHSAFGHILVSLPPVMPNNPAPFAMIQGSRATRSLTAVEDFLTLLCHSRICDAGDSRDKVFALYSFFSDAAQKGLRADYSVSKTSVYTKTTEWLLDHFGLSVLSCVWGDPDRRDNSLPSWVPDWANRTVRPEWYFGIPIRQELVTDVDATFWPTSAAGTTKPHISIHDSSDGSRQLVVRGLIVDRIERTGCILERENQDVSQLAANNRSKSGLPNIIYDFEPHPNARGLPNWMMKYGFPARLNCPGSEEDINMAYHNSVRERDLAATESGYLGLVLEGTRQGDLVCILLGAGVPFVLRPEKDYWRLIGEAYIYGLMQAEAVYGLDVLDTDGEVAQDPLVDFVIR